MNYKGVIIEESLDSTVMLRDIDFELKGDKMSGCVHSIPILKLIKIQITTDSVGSPSAFNSRSLL